MLKRLGAIWMVPMTVNFWVFPYPNHMWTAADLGSISAQRSNQKIRA